MPALAQVVARWDKFLQSITARHDEILREAQAGCAQLLIDNDYDTHAFGLAWGAMGMRAQQLTSKISDTWDEKVSPMFDELDLDAGIEDQQSAKGYALHERLEVELEAARVNVFADAARAVWRRAVEQAPPHLSCSQCGGPVPVPSTLSAVNVTCGSCSAVVTYEPGARLRSIEHFCVHPLAEEAAWAQWLARHAAEQALSAARDETLALLKEVERTQIEYWRAYLTTRAALLPTFAPAFDKDLRGKLQYWYELQERSGAWVAAGSPRALP